MLKSERLSVVSITVQALLHRDHVGKLGNDYQIQVLELLEDEAILVFCFH